MIILAIILVGLVAVVLYTTLSAPTNTGPWTQTYTYPLQAGGSSAVVGQSCVDSAGYVYCIGGDDANSNPSSAVYYAEASSSGVGNWTVSANPYPQTIEFESCTTASGYVYCVAGTHDANGDDTNASYYATLSPLGVGPWVETTPFPVATDALSCATTVGDLYCMGGENETTGTNATTTLSSAVWYASVSSTGIGTWKQSADYPVGLYFPSCTSLGGYVYCVGGENAQHVPENATYYAYVTPAGMGPWTAAPDYPIQTIAESCATSYSSIFCIGGLESGGTTTSAVYYASVSSAGLGSWQSAASYPIGVATDCVSNAGLLYCVGGYESSVGPTGNSYYALLNATASSSTST